MPTSPLPHGHTAQRLTWEFLPPEVREAVARQLGSEVVENRSCDGGFTPGLASVLTCADGTRAFVKAASRKAQQPIAASYAEEARVLRLLQDLVPAPRLLWVHDGDWLVMGFEHVEGRAPARPWRLPELERALDLAEQIADALDPLPEGTAFEPLVEAVPELVTAWSALAGRGVEDPHLEEVDRLARSFADLPDRALCHADLRDDNILLGEDGRAVACDWNWPGLGPAWLDTVDLLASARGDGIDPGPILARRRLTRDADPEAIDAWLAASCGSMSLARTRPVPTSSPYLRAHAAWQADVLWDWLADRRGW